MPPDPPSVCVLTHAPSSLPPQSQVPSAAPATDLLNSAANKATVCLLAGSAVSFSCLQNWRKRRRPDLYVLEEEDDMAKLCKVWSCRLTAVWVQLWLTALWVQLRLTAVWVRLWLTAVWVRMVSVLAVCLPVGQERKNVTFGCAIKHLQCHSLCLVRVSVLWWSYGWRPIGTGVEGDRQFVGVSQTSSARLLQWPHCHSRNRFFYHIDAGPMWWLLPGWQTAPAIEWIVVGAVDVVASCHAARHLQSRPHSLCYQKRLYRAGDLGPRPRLCPGTWPVHSMLEGTGATTECLPEPGCSVWHGDGVGWLLWTGRWGDVGIDGQQVPPWLQKTVFRSMREGAVLMSSDVQTRTPVLARGHLA